MMGFRSNFFLIKFGGEGWIGKAMVLGSFTTFGRDRCHVERHMVSHASEPRQGRSRSCQRAERDRQIDPDGKIHQVSGRENHHYSFLVCLSTLSNRNTQYQLTSD